MAVNIYEKLSKVQQELKAPKDKKNTFAGYNYRSAEGILEAVKPVLVKYGSTITLADEIEEIGDRIYVKATARFIDITDGSALIGVTAYAREAAEKKGLDVSQVTGTASSYARKYALNGLLLIDDTKDADTDEYQKQTGSAKKGEQAEKTDEYLNEPIDEKTVALIEKMAKDAGVDLSIISKKPLSSYTNKQAGALMQSLRKKIEGNK